MSIWGMFFGKRKQTPCDSPDMQRTAAPAAIFHKPTTLDLFNYVAERNVPQLIDALSKGSWPVRVKAAQALGKLQDPAAIDPLCAALNGGFWAEAVHQVDAASQGYEDQPTYDEERDRKIECCVDIILNWGRKAEDAAAFALASIGGDRAIRALVTCMKLSTNYARLAGALSKAGSPAVPILLEALSEPRQDISVLYGVLDALGRIGDDRAFAPMVSLFSHHNCNVANSAIVALGRLGDKRAIAVLESVMKEGSKDIGKVHIVGALGQLLDADVVRTELLPALLRGELVQWHDIAGVLLPWGDRPDAALIPVLLSILTLCESRTFVHGKLGLWQGVEGALLNALRNHSGAITTDQLQAIRSISNRAARTPDGEEYTWDFKGVREMACRLLEKRDNAAKSTGREPGRRQHVRRRRGR